MRDFIKDFDNWVLFELNEAELYKDGSLKNDIGKIINLAFYRANTEELVSKENSDSILKNKSKIEKKKVSITSNETYNKNGFAVVSSDGGLDFSGNSGKSDFISLINDRKICFTNVKGNLVFSGCPVNIIPAAKKTKINGDCDFSNCSLGIQNEGKIFNREIEEVLIDGNLILSGNSSLEKIDLDTIKKIDIAGKIIATNCPSLNLSELSEFPLKTKKDKNITIRIGKDSKGLDRVLDIIFPIPAGEEKKKEYFKNITEKLENTGFAKPYIEKILLTIPEYVIYKKQNQGIQK